MKSPIEITVSQRYGTYQTNTVQGQRASCTAGAEGAAQLLAGKLFGAAFDRIEHLGDGTEAGSTIWRLHAAPLSYQELSAVRIAQLIKGLGEACDQLEGWVSSKCPKRHMAEHLANIARLRELLK